MASTERAIDRGTRSGHRQLIQLGDDLREQRLSLGLSQEHVAASGRISRSRCSRIEGGSVDTFSIMELNRLTSALGLDAGVRLYPGGVPVRDVAHAGKLQSLLRLSAAPLQYRIEVPLRHEDGRDRRAWDAMLFGHGKRTAIELEMRLRDVQAVRRRLDLKWRDDPTDGFLLLIADTRHNRRVLAEFAALFADLPRLRPSSVRKALLAGQHPPTGLVLV
jgi:transcriptional regulator with XRE-family HTH domain